MNDDASPTGAFPSTSDPRPEHPPDQRATINVVVAGSDFYVGENNFVFGITDAQDLPQGGATARATFYDLRDSGNPKPAFTVEAVQSAPGVGEQVQHVHANGETHVHGGQDEDRVGYYAPAIFDHAGPWGIAVEATLKDGTQGVASVGFQGLCKAYMPAPGQDAYKCQPVESRCSRTSRDRLGRTANEMHD